MLGSGREQLVADKSQDERDGTNLGARNHRSSAEEDHWLLQYESFGYPAWADTLAMKRIHEKSVYNLKS